MRSTIRFFIRSSWLCIVASVCAAGAVFIPSVTGAEDVPLPEHPRPDFERADWLNLNGGWQFRFDGGDVGLGEKWGAGEVSFPDRILVPFPWGSPLSGLEDRAAIAWYARTVRVPEGWACFW